MSSMRTRRREERRFFFDEKKCQKKKRSVKYSESPKKHYCPQVGVRPKYRKKSSFLVIYLHCMARKQSP